MTDFEDDKEVRVIIGSPSIRSDSGASSTLDHMLSCAKNEYAACIQRAPADLKDMFEDAKARGQLFGPKLIMIAPHLSLSRERMLSTVLPLLARVMGFPAEEAVIFEHRLERKGGEANVHWHMAINHANPITGKVRDWSWTYAKAERCSRTLEVLLGEQIQVGRSQSAVIRALRNDGEHDLADAIESAHPPHTEPKGRTAKRQLEQPAKRVGEDLREVGPGSPPAGALPTISLPFPPRSPLRA